MLDYIDLLGIIVISSLIQVIITTIVFLLFNKMLELKIEAIKAEIKGETKDMKGFLQTFKANLSKMGGGSGDGEGSIIGTILQNLPNIMNTVGVMKHYNLDFGSALKMLSGQGGPETPPDSEE